MGFIIMASELSSMVETWQVVAAASGVLVTVLTIYGGIIKRNYDTTSTIKQRLLGADGDDTDDGFLQQTIDKLDSLGSKMDSHHAEVEQGLRENRARVGSVERQVERVEYKVDAVAQVVEDEHDVLFRGGSDSPETDGGRPAGPENERLSEHRHDAGD
ncbi:hypothetical protein M197_gp65 [Haloarcula hispanica tailed virus 2]|uniref:DUF2746 domain-containing protein n=1 Tax=Haloarcula hispanica tailed virus 2 TaxID=1273751 RepID=R4T8L3_9CAUD|nr:hypothetical protein M197_gp65 [Haloarcula hispanica tailed virus 2]AGM11230.1 hypothetical protein HHTV2_65 [Haloarcula hispanica tailed virus 2]